MVILNPTETSPGGGGANFGQNLNHNGNNEHHVLSPARGSPLVPSLPGAETYGLQNALKRWRALEQQSIPLENQAQELIYARERKDFDDLRRRYFESKRSKMESKESSSPPTSSKQIIPIPKHQPQVSNFCDPNFPMMNHHHHSAPILNRSDFYNGQMPAMMMSHQNLAPNLVKERPKLKRKVSVLDEEYNTNAVFLNQEIPSTNKPRRKAVPATQRGRKNAAGQAAAFFDNTTQCLTTTSNQMPFHVPDLPDDVVAEFVNNSNQLLFDDVWKNADLNEFFEPSLQNYPENGGFVPLTSSVVQPQLNLDPSTFFDRNSIQNFPHHQSETHFSFNYVQNQQNFNQISSSQNQIIQQQPQFQAVQQQQQQQNFPIYSNQCQQRMPNYDSQDAIRSMQRYTSNFNQFF